MGSKTDSDAESRLKELAHAEVTAAKERLTKRTAAARDYAAAVARLTEAAATPQNGSDPVSRPGRLQEHIAVRTRPGRRFLPTEELELGAVLRDLACRLPGASSGIIVIPEMAGPSGLPDLVAVPVTHRLECRLALPCPPILAFGDVRLITACSSLRPTSLRVLSRRLEVPEDALRRRAHRLERQGALLPANGGWLRPRAIEPIGRLYALEAKVDDWNAGLGQALRYGSWADASAAVMARLPRDPSRAITQASRLGLGLAHGPRWLVRPTVRRLSLAQRLWASEHVIAAIRPT